MEDNHDKNDHERALYGEGNRIVGVSLTHGAVEDTTIIPVTRNGTVSKRYIICMCVR